MIASEFVRPMLQALVIGVFGGAGLVLTQLYSRRGPLIFPVYGAILVALTLSLGRASTLGYVPRFLAALGGMVVSTTIAMTATVIFARPARSRLVASGRPMEPGSVPLWAAPLMLLLLTTVSAAAAYVSM